jgi:tetratricopeptide (TPR) repeat protein
VERVCYSWKSVVGGLLVVVLGVLRANGGEFGKATDLGYEALRRGDYDTAIARFGEAIRAEPANPEAYRGRGVAYGRKGRFDLAVGELTKAIQLDPTKPEAYTKRAGAYLFLGDYGRAIADCNDALRLDPGDETAYNNRGYGYLCQGKTQLAIADLSKAIRIDPRDAKAYANRGLAWHMERDYVHAIADLDEAIRIRKTAEVLRVRASAYAYQGKCAQAINDLNEAIQIDPTSAESYHQRASVYTLTGDKQQAIADFTSEIRLDPRSAEAYGARAACLGNCGRYEEAIADTDTAIQLLPSSPCFYEERGTLWILRGDYQRGAADIEKVIHLNPNDTAAAFESWPKPAISQTLLAHGERQVQRMLQDRPAMSYQKEEAKVLYGWAARKFAGEDLGRRVFWDGSEPPPDTTCENQPPRGGDFGFILVSGKYIDGPDKGKTRSSEEMWHDAVFELYNISNDREFSRLTANAASGRMSKEDFVANVIECESHAAEKTRAFYIHVFMPWARDHHLPTHPQLWHLAHRSESQQSIMSFTAASDPYWKHYERMYDWIMQEEARKQQR